MKPIIKVENLSKQYRLGAFGTGTVREDVQRWMHRIRGKEDPYLKVGEANDRSRKGESEYVWALQDINFEVMPGEVLGIIGKNGAGKSTLLKILSKVTGPTTGRIDFNGRISSLLEVGTGFHPELTGRENIFLNGAILGMTKREIKAKFDEIIDFSGCERYIDTPVKRYSSGMTVRLGFAVAAHLDPEILIVDEVLAVGDAEFQKKAIGKMQDASRNEGRTVLFVSHNMAAIENLCNKGIIIQNGQLTYVGGIQQAINKYINSTTNPTNNKVGLRTDRSGSLNIKIVKVEVLDMNDSLLELVLSGQNIKIILHFENLKNIALKNLSVAISLRRDDGVLATVFCNEYTNDIIEGNTSNKFTCEIPKLPLMEGNYLMNFMIINNNETEDWIQEGALLKVANGDFFRTGKITESTHRSFLVEHKWY